MFAALAGESPVRAGSKIAVGKTGKMPVLDPFLVASVDLADQQTGKTLENFDMIRRSRKIAHFMRIGFYIEELIAVAGRIIDELETSVVNHPCCERILPDFSIEPVSFFISGHG